MLRRMSEPVYRPHARIISADGIEHPPSNDFIQPGLSYTVETNEDRNRITRNIADKRLMSSQQQSAITLTHGSLISKSLAKAIKLHI